MRGTGREWWGAGARGGGHRRRGGGVFHVKHAGRPRHAGPACRGAPEGALRGGEGLAANGAGPAGRVIDCGVRSRCSRRHLQVGRLAISRRVASRPRAALARTDYQGKDEREDCADDSRSASTAPPRKRTVHPASIASGNTPQERGGLVDRGRGFRSAGKRGANRAAWARAEVAGSAGERVGARGGVTGGAGGGWTREGRSGSGRARDEEGTRRPRGGRDGKRMGGGGNASRAAWARAGGVAGSPGGRMGAHGGVVGRRAERGRATGSDGAGEAPGQRSRRGLRRRRSLGIRRLGTTPLRRRGPHGAPRRRRTRLPAQRERKERASCRNGEADGKTAFRLVTHQPHAAGVCERRRTEIS